MPGMLARASRFVSRSRPSLVGAALAAFALAAAPAASAQQCAGTLWAEDLDGLAPGAFLPQTSPGEWEPWDGIPAAGNVEVVTMPFDSPPHALRIQDADDLVRLLQGFAITSGTWQIATRVYVPSGTVGTSYFILLNTYVSGGAKNWSTQVRLDPGAGVVESELETRSVPIVLDAWTPLRVVIDLDADAQYVFYDETLISAKSWTAGVSGGGALRLDAIDLFGNGSTAVYYDDFALCELQPVAGRVLCAAAADDDGPYRDAIATLADVQVDYLDARTATPDAALLSFYDAAHVWATEPFADPTGFGDGMAGYADNGGCVILGSGSAGRLNNTAIMARSPAISRAPSSPQHGAGDTAVIAPGECGLCMFRDVQGPLTCTVADKLMLNTLGGAVGARAGAYPGLQGPGGSGDPEIVCAYWPSGSPAVIYANGSGGPWSTPNDIPCWITGILVRCHGIKVDDCPPDVTSDGAVSFDDLVTVLANWGQPCNAADIDGSGYVDLGDLLAVLSGWGPCT